MRADKIAKQAKEMSNAYWKSVEFAKECYELMKVINEKLLNHHRLIYPNPLLWKTEKIQG